MFFFNQPCLFFFTVVVLLCCFCVAAALHALSGKNNLRYVIKTLKTLSVYMCVQNVCSFKNLVGAAYNKVRSIVRKLWYKYLLLKFRPPLFISLWWFALFVSIKLNGQHYCYSLKFSAYLMLCPLSCVDMGRHEACLKCCEFCNFHRDRLGFLYICPKLFHSAEAEPISFTLFCVALKSHFLSFSRNIFDLNMFCDFSQSKSSTILLVFFHPYRVAFDIINQHCPATFLAKACQHWLVFETFHSSTHLA